MSCFRLLQVGTYDEGNLNLQTGIIRFYKTGMDGACSATLCNHCSHENVTLPPTQATTTLAPTDQDSFSIPDWVIIGILGLVLVAILIMCIIIVCYFRSRVTGKLTVH